MIKSWHCLQCSLLIDCNTMVSLAWIIQRHTLLCVPKNTLRKKESQISSLIEPFLIFNDNGVQWHLKISLNRDSVGAELWRNNGYSRRAILALYFSQCDFCHVQILIKNSHIKFTFLVTSSELLNGTQSSYFRYSTVARGWFREDLQHIDERKICHMFSSCRPDQDPRALQATV